MAEVEVFETEDERQTADEVNKADIWKEQVRLDPETDSIETTHQSAVDAYAVFATSTALRPVGDHSGSAEAFERLRAYSVPKGSLETPLQKLERLKLETAELTATMEVAQTQGGLAAAQFPGSTAAELGELQEKLSGITRAMSSDAPVLEAMSGSTAEKLMQDLGAYSAAVDGGGKGAPAAEAGGGGGGNVTYELYLEPGSAGVALDKVADLERRLAALEQTTGAGGAELPQDLATMVRGLSDRVSLLDKSALQKLTKEVTDATRLMHEASQRKDRLNHEQTEQIGKVAAAVTKWSPVAEELPMIVERLYQLKRVHAQAAQYAGSVKSITDEQTAISGGLKSQDALLRQVQASLQENIKTMSGNIKALEARFDKAKLKK